MSFCNDSTIKTLYTNDDDDDDSATVWVFIPIKTTRTEDYIARIRGVTISWVSSNSK